MPPEPSRTEIRGKLANDSKVELIEVADLLLVLDGRSADSSSPRDRSECGATKLAEIVGENRNLTEVRDAWVHLLDRHGGNTFSLAA